MTTTTTKAYEHIHYMCETRQPITVCERGTCPCGSQRYWASTEGTWDEELGGPYSRMVYGTIGAVVCEGCEAVTEESFAAADIGDLY